MSFQIITLEANDVIVLRYDDVSTEDISTEDISTEDIKTLQTVLDTKKIVGLDRDSDFTIVRPAKKAE